MGKDDLTFRNNLITTTEQLKEALKYYTLINKAKSETFKRIYDSIENISLCIKLVEKESCFVNKHSAYCIQEIERFIKDYQDSFDPVLRRVIGLQKNSITILLMHMNPEITHY